MMNSLFSTFDPSSSIASWSWISASSLVVIMMMKFTKVTSNKLVMGKTILTTILGELESEKSYFKKSSTITTLTLFSMVMILNLSSVYPYIFSTTGQINVTLWASLGMWLSINLMALNKSVPKYIVHLVPQGTPTALMNFMVLIELVSNIIRPITLSVRLMANMVAGHLLLILLGSLICSMSEKSMFVSPAMIILITLEVAVSFIQAYVMATLVSLYYKEM